MNKADIARKDKTGFTELEDKYWRALRLIQTHVNEPDVVKSIVDKAIGAEEDVIPIEEPEPETDNNKHFGEEQAEGLDSLLEGLKDTPHDDRW